MTKDAVFDSFGVLEHVLSYSEVPDLLSASLVNKRWHQAARSDDLWEDACRILWKGKWGYQEEENKELALFWRSRFSREAIGRMTESQLRAFLNNTLVAGDATEQEEQMRGKVLELQESLPTTEIYFNDLWFGSYACSVKDSRRSYITPAELCHPRGFDMYITMGTDIEDIRMSGAYSTCHFLPSKTVSMRLRDLNAPRPSDQAWTLSDAGDRVKVGTNHPLSVSRRGNWGWELDFMQVVMKSR